MQKKIITSLVVLGLLSGCAAVKHVIRSVDDIARDLCEQHFSAHPPDGVSLEDIEEHAKTYCRIRENVEPWLGEAKRLRADGVSKAAPAEGAAGGAAQ